MKIDIFNIGLIFVKMLNKFIILTLKSQALHLNTIPFSTNYKWVLIQMLCTYLLYDLFSLKLKLRMVLEPSLSTWVDVFLGKQKENHDYNVIFVQKIWDFPQLIKLNAEIKTWPAPDIPYVSMYFIFIL